MLSMFDDDPALESEKPLRQHGHGLAKAVECTDQKAPMMPPTSSTRKVEPVSLKNSDPFVRENKIKKAGRHSFNVSKVRDEDNLDIETVLQEMDNIEGMA